MAVELPEAVLPQVRRSGVLFGLSGPQLMIVVACIAWVVITELSAGPVVMVKSLLVIGPIVAVGTGSWRGRTFLSRIGVEMLLALRKAAAQTSAVTNVDKPRKEGHLEIPGSLGERMRVLDLLGTRYPGAAMVWDAATGEATAVLRVTTEAWNLAGTGVQSSRAAAFSNVCRSIARLNGVTRVKTHARTIPRGTEHLRFDDGTEGLSWFASEEYDEVLASQALGTAPYRDVLVTLTISQDKASAAVKEAGGGLRGVSSVLADRVATMLSSLPAAGVRVHGATWLGTGQIRTSSRLACDPAAAFWLSPTGTIPDRAVVCSSIRERRDYLELDSAMTRTWWVEVMPAMPVEAGFLDNLISAGGFSHTVSEVFVPADVRSSEKRLKNAEQAHRSVADRDEKLGRDSSAAHVAEAKELVQRRADLVAGFGDVRWSVYVTASAPTTDGLDEIEAWLETACPEIGLNGMRGQQLSAFTLSGLALGIGPRS